MTKEEILTFFYDVQSFEAGKNGWVSEFNADKFKKVKLNIGMFSRNFDKTVEK